MTGFVTQHYYIRSEITISELIRNLNSQIKFINSWITF